MIMRVPAGVEPWLAGWKLSPMINKRKIVVHVILSLPKIGMLTRDLFAVANLAVVVAAGQWSYGADIIFVLDESESIGSSVNFQLLKSYLRYLVGRFDYDDGNTRVGLVTYSTNVGTYVSLMHSTLGSLRSAISALRYNGGKTNTAAALAYVRKVMLTQGSGYRNYLPNVVVLIVAGPSYDLAATQVSAEYLPDILFYTN